METSVLMANDKETAGCQHLGEYLTAQIKLIRRHLRRHKHFRQIAEDEDAIRDFVLKFNGEIRQVYCGFTCDYRADCDIAKRDYRPVDNVPQRMQEEITGRISTIPRQSSQDCYHLNDIIRVMASSLAKNVDEHQKVQHISDRTEAIIDFLTKYDWIDREIYCGSTCPDREKCEFAKQYQTDEVPIDE